jgi:protein-L-isoaspartate(D-aspartate) O-methyltransferase
MTNISALHQGLIDKLKQEKFIRSSHVEAAFRQVPRHLFLPDIPGEKVYQDDAIITKYLDGMPISSSSQPAIMAIMLEQLDLQVGDRVLEIGAGTGYNSALMAHIVGETGEVIAVDIDEDIVEGARQNLAKAGLERVKVICADGGFGYGSSASYDRIILTVAAWDIAPAWREQLKPNGRLILPLTLKEDVQVTAAFELADGYLVSVSATPCGFMKLRGAFAESQEQQLDMFVHSRKIIQRALFLPFVVLPVEWRLKLYNLKTFGHFSLNNFRIRAYPHNVDYTPSENETVIIKNWNKLVLDWR